MYKGETTIRVRYAETDRMGYVYYGNYAQYYEVGRVEALRNIGFPYRKIEDSGIILPVRDFSIRYFLPAYYDDLLTIITEIPELPTTRLHFNYKCLNEAGKLLNEGNTTLVFVDQSTGRPCQPPADFLKALQPFFIGSSLSSGPGSQ